MSFLDVCRFTPTLGGTTDWTYSTAVQGYQGPAAAGAVNGGFYRYRAESADLSQWEVGEGVYNSGTGILTRARVRFNSAGTTAKINFSTVPQVGIVAIAEDLQGLIPPQGRLTLTSATPVMASTVAAATAHIYTNAGGGTLPLTYDGGLSFVNVPFVESSQNCSDATKSPAACVPNAIYDIYGWDDAGTLRFTRSDYWKKANTATMTIASPAVVTVTGNDYDDGCPIVFTTSGALPTGVVAGTTYFVKQTTPGVIANTFNISATVGGAAVNTSGTQSGTHAATACDKTGAVARATGGNCEIDFSKTFPINKNAITNGPAGGAGTWVGTIMTNSAGTLDWIFPSVAASFGAGVFGLWNMYNRVEVRGFSGDNTANFYSYAVANTWRAAHGSNTARIALVRGLDIDPIEMKGNLYAIPGAATTMSCGFGIDTTTAISAVSAAGWNNAGAQHPAVPYFEGLPGLGRHFVSLNEWQNTATSCAWKTLDASSGSQVGFSVSLWS